MACATDQVCSAGVCASSCGQGLTQCGASCVDLSSTFAHCGACNAACPPGQSCSAGRCGCLPGQTQCGSSCTNTLTDGSNCGTCGNVCPDGAACVSGVCQGGVGGAGGQGAGGSGGQSGGTGGQSAGGSAGQSAGGTGGQSAGGTGGQSTGGSGGSGGQSAGGSGGQSAGGSSGSGGSGGTGTTGPCSRPVGSCTSPTVVITEIDMGVPITPYGSEFDTLPLPMAIAAKPSGGSRIAVRATDGTIHIGDLDCNDNLVGTPFSLTAVDLQDLHADDDGGVVMLTRDANGSGEHHCGPNTLCGGTSAPCYNSLLVRFDNAGNEVWATPVTNANTIPGYTNGSRFVWGHYQHHGRIAFDGSNYAAYFCIGITVNNGGCVDIHEGDRMQVVSSNGTLISNHPDSFQVGCSHSWVTRIVWDPRANRFVMVCTTDNNCRIAQPNPYRTVASGTCNGTLFGGDLVLSSRPGTPGYWTAWSQDGQIRLEHFTTGASDTTIMNAGASQHPHLVSYGPTRMLLSWGSGSGMAAQVRDSNTGATIGSQFTINVPDHDYQAFKAYPDGSVAYPAAGTSNTKVRIARVMPCSG